MYGTTRIFLRNICAGCSWEYEWENLHTDSPQWWTDNVKCGSLKGAEALKWKVM